jgi:hypothetical protein
MAINGFDETQASIHEREDWNLKVFEDGEFGKDVHNLERTTNPFFHPLMDGEVSDVLVTEKDFS